jgi:hypothetical protein
VAGSYAAISAAETSYPPEVERPRNCSVMKGVPAKAAAESEAARSGAKCERMRISSFKRGKTIQM